jgi:hypothetical protein
VDGGRTLFCPSVPRAGAQADGTQGDCRLTRGPGSGLELGPRRRHHFVLRPPAQGAQDQRPAIVSQECRVRLASLPNLRAEQLTSMKFGRTSVIDLHEECLELLRKLVKEGALEGFVEKSVQIESATEYYELFDKRKIGKVVFRAFGGDRRFLG